MAPLLDCEQFWRTRFLLHGERGYLHFLTKDNYQDWRLLYRCTRSSVVWPIKLHDWRQQWLTNENIRDSYLMIEEASTTLEDGKPQSTEFDASLEWEKSPKSCAHDLHNFRNIDPLISQSVSTMTYTICSLCGRSAFRSKSHIISIPAQIFAITFSSLVQDERTLITGFGLIHGFGVASTAFGYRIPGKQTTVYLRGQTFKGFEIKFDLDGIQALRVITDVNDLLYDGWAGQHEGPHSIVTTRVISDNPIVAISGESQVSQKFPSPKLLFTDKSRVLNLPGLHSH
ncbi:hypothetical protein N7528_006842 [Penicillium herquei]|nr:hypothetical protein N7528_006842 [Penicillium herquei]